MCVDAGSVFGGQLLLWMEKSATFCAKNFARNQNMVDCGPLNTIFVDIVHRSQWVLGGFSFTSQFSPLT